MAAFQTNTLVGGVWTGQTVDLRAVLEHHQRKDAKASESRAVEVLDPPDVGFYSQTILDAPVIHWILPCRLRSQRRHDVAFIGHYCVQIREFRGDGHLQDVARMTNFGSRILAACVMTITSLQSGTSSVSSANKSKDNDGDASVSESTSEADISVPPQCLVLALQDGILVFLQAINTEHGVEFLVSRHALIKPVIGEFPGIQMAIDPSSSYLSISSFQGIFVTCSLRPREELFERQLSREPLDPIVAEKYTKVEGIIHKMEYLYPALDDPEHIILLLLVINDNRSRLLVFEWETGQSLSTIKAHSRRGHLLAENFKIPLLMIPLRLKTAFLLVCETSIAMYKDILLGSPIYDVVEIEVDPPTELHCGSRPPLWSAWARPARMDHYASKHDDLYIAREDGVVRFLETIDADIGPYMSIGSLNCTVGTAFASLDPDRRTPKLNGDLLIAGGETGNGGMYEVKARKVAAFVEPIANWSPMIDFVTTSTLTPESTPPDFPSTRDEYILPHVPSKADRIYACSGKGIGGSVAELRHGVEARIGFEIDYSAPIFSSWILPAGRELSTTRGASRSQERETMLILMNMGSHTSLLSLSDTEGSVVEVDQNLTPLDLSSPTLLMKTFHDVAVQVTNSSLVLASGPLATENIETVVEVSVEVFPLGQKIVDVAITDDQLLILATESELRLLSIINKEPQKIGDAIDLEGEVTCLKFIEIADELFGLCGLVSPTSGATLNIYHIDPKNGMRLAGNYRPGLVNTTPDPCLQALTSAIVLEEHAGPDKLLLLGLRNGGVIALKITKTQEGVAFSPHSTHKFGVTTISLISDGPFAAFVCCENRVYRITTKRRGDRAQAALSMHRIWFTDAANPAMPQPKANVNSISRAHNHNVLFAFGTQLFLVDFEDQPKGVPRHLRVGGTPMRVIYSHILDALVVAVLKDGKTSLRFLDEESGEDISSPVDRHGEPAAYIAGLGKENERILGLTEWVFRDPHGSIWNSILVCTSGGRLLLVSAERSKDDPRKISFVTRNKYKGTGPIITVAGTDRGIFFCVGKNLRWETLDLNEKRFKKVYELELPSPAVSIRIHKNIILLITRKHSLLSLRIPEPRQPKVLTPLFTDEIYRSGLHQTMVREDVALVSDMDGCVTGLWSPLLEDESTTFVTTGVARPLFEAESDTSIVRFRQGYVRPIWDRDWRLEAPGNAEILGITVHGSLRYFKVLDLPIWKLMRLLQDLAESSPRYAPITFDRLQEFGEDQATRLRRKHINGDVLRQVADAGGLGALLQARLWKNPPTSIRDNSYEAWGDNDLEPKKAREIEVQFNEIMRDLTDTPGHSNDVQSEDPLKRAYALLDAIVRPVI